jgi:hypothetical protein
MTYFDKFLMQGLSKYYKKNYHDFFKKILKLFVKYSKNKPIQSNPKEVGVVHVIVFAPMRLLLMNLMC